MFSIFSSVLGSTLTAFCCLAFLRVRYAIDRGFFAFFFLFWGPHLIEHYFGVFWVFFVVFFFVFCFFFFFFFFCCLLLLDVFFVFFWVFFFFFFCLWVRIS